MSNSLPNRSFPKIDVGCPWKMSLYIFLSTLSARKLNEQCLIFSDEAESILSNMEGVTEQLLDEKKLMKKLEMDKRELKEKINRPQSQLDAIKVKEEDCQNRCQELEIRYTEEKERLSLIEDTVQRIGKSKEMVHNFASSLNLDDYDVREPDVKEPFILYTDASLTAMGAVLAKVQNGKERAICYASKAFSKSQTNYSATKRELSAIVTFTRHFNHYLLGRKIKIVIDHRALQWLHNFKDLDGLTARWLEKLAAFDYEVQHRPSKSIGHADGLSRIPIVNQVTISPSIKTQMNQ